MSVTLPDLDASDFAAALAECSPVKLSTVAVDRLFIHYHELVRWNPRLSLVGPGTVDEVLSRHYGESLAALELLDDTDRCLVDVGSGAGFPGYVLAAARPDLEVTLVEARQKKWAFLSLVCEKAALPCRCLNARVSAALAGEFPRQIDVVSTRAVKLSRAEIGALSRRLSPRGRFLAWSGLHTQAGMAEFSRGREVVVANSQHRRIEELFPSTTGIA